MKARFFVGSLAMFPDAHAIALRAQHELSVAGFADSRAVLSPTWECVLVKVEVGRDLSPAGIIAFQQYADRSLIWVELSYTVDEYRGRGVYKHAYAVLRAIAKERRCRSIESMTHFQNMPMRAAAKRMGRREEFVGLVDNIEIEPDEREL